MKYDYIACGNCIDLMRELPDKSVDLVVTDPPYLMDYKTNRRKDKSHKFCTSISGDDNPELIKAYIKECHRIMKDNTAMYMFCNSNKVDFFKQELEKYFKIKNIIVWVKNNHTAGDLVAQFGKKYEFIFLVNKGRCPIRDGRITDVWQFPKVSADKLLHQNQKPLELVQQCIEKHSDVGAVVFDGFIGSGTTCVAAKNTGRHYIGFELDSEYFAIAQSRIGKWQDCGL